MIFQKLISGGGGAGGSAGNPVVSGAVNGSGELILTLQSGAQINCGVVFDGTGNPVTSGTVNGSGELVLTLADGTQINAGVVTQDLTSAFDAKVDKVAGKQLSTEDYTTAEKAKLAGLNVDFTVSTETLVAGQLSTKALTSAQTSYGLQAYALKEEQPIVVSSAVVNAEPATVELTTVSSETLTAAVDGAFYSVTPSDQFNAVSISAGALSNVVQTPMTADSSLGQLVTVVSGGKAGGGALYNAFNGVEGNGYTTNGGPVMSIGSVLQLDLGSQKTFSKYRFYRTDGGGYSYKTNQWQLSGSNDGTTFTQIDAVTLQTSDPNWYESVDMGVQSYRYIRISLIAGANGYATVGELELLGASNSVLIESAGSYYAVENDALVAVAAPASSADIAASGFSAGAVSSSGVAAIAPYKIVSANADDVSLVYSAEMFESVAVSGLSIASADAISDVVFSGISDRAFVQKEGNHYAYTGAAWTAYGAALSVAGGNVVAPMTANSSSGQVATASSSWSGYEPYEAFNGTYSGYSDSWLSGSDASAGAPQWIAIDLGSKKTITGYALRNQNYGTPYPATDWTLEGSNDGASWTVLHAVVNDTSNLADSGLRSYLDIGVFSYQHYRVSVTAGPSGTVSFSDIQLIGAGYDIATDGNTTAELEALTSEQWMQLYQGGLTDIAFSYQSTTDLAGMSATVTLATGDPAAPSAWVQCDASDVAIRWYDDKVTFTPSANGTYKLAYQDAV